MPRRRQFTGVAHALLGSFVSRNNDVDGYWGIGQLYKHAQLNNAVRVEIDLLSRTVSPAGKPFDALARQYANLLMKQLTSQRLPAEWLFEARISIAFGEAHHRAPWPSDFGNYECCVELTDDIRNIREARMRGTCWPHDPAREFRSARASA